MLKLSGLEIFAALCLISSVHAKLKVSIYYEALCSDSTDFIVNQLKPAYPALKDNITIEFLPYGKANHYFYYGNWIFNCQHGPAECFGNQLQACALNQGLSDQHNVNFVSCVMKATDPSNRKTVQHLQMAVPNLQPVRMAIWNKPYILKVCVYLDIFSVQVALPKTTKSPMSYVKTLGTVKEKTGGKCATSNGFSWKQIRTCYNTGLANYLLAAHGDRTHSVYPAITFVPTIIFNDVYDANNQNGALKNFKQTVRQKLTNNKNNPNFIFYGY